VRQTQKNLVSLLVMTVLAGGLGLYAWFGVLKTDEAESERKEVSDKLFPGHEAGARASDGGALPPPVITWLQVVAKGDTTTLERQKDGTWRITAPEKAAADSLAVDGLVQQLVSGKFKASVEDNPSAEDLKRYGLEPPRLTVSANGYLPDESGGGEGDESRKRKVTLHGGIDNPYDNTLYLRREGDPKAYVADSSLRFSLERSTFDLRDKSVLKVDESTVQRVEVKARKSSYVLERDSERNWRVVQPVAQRADEARVAQALQSLNVQQATAFVPDLPDVRTKLGLEKPLVELRFTLSSGEPVRVRMSRVERDDQGKVLVLREQGSEAILAEVPELALDVLDLSTQDLKDKRLLPFQEGQVQQIVVRPGGSEPEIRLQKVAAAPWDDKSAPQETWQVTAPQQGKALEQKVTAMLSALSNLKAAALGESKPKRWDTYGITDQSRAVVLLGADGKELAKLQLGSEVKGNTSRTWARGLLEDVAEVDSFTLNDIPKAVTDILEPPPATAGNSEGGGTTGAPTP
jgi:hypothetical protein